MLTEPAKELNAGKKHLFLVVIAVVMVFEPHSMFIHRKEPMIADGRFMRVPAKVLHHLLRATEWFFRIDYPIGLFKFHVEGRFLRSAFVKRGDKLYPSLIS